MAGPRFRPARELPTTSWAQWDNVRRVRVALNELERGVFDMAAQIVDAMGRDDRIEAELDKRTGALVGLPMTFEPQGDGRSSPSVTREVETAFDTFYPEGTRRELQKWGIMLGVGVGQNVWDAGVSRWSPTLKVWHPRTLTWNETTASFWIQTADGPREVTPGDGEWILYTPGGNQRPWFKGAVRSLCIPWLLRQWGMRDWGRASEVYGQPTRKAVTPMNANQEDTERFVREVALVGAETTIKTPRAGMEEWERYDLELVEATKDFSGSFEKLIDKADTCITIRLAGQNLSTEVKGGSYAAAKEHNGIRNDYLRADAKSVGQCLHDQSLTWWAQYNHGSKELAPIPGWITDPPEDKKAKAESMKTLGEAITAIRATGAKPDIDKILKQHGVPTTGPAELQPPNPAADPMGDQEDDEDPSPGQDPAPDAKKRPKPKLRAASRAARDNGPAIEAQLYLDDVVEEGAVAARQALNVDLKRIVDLLDEAGDYEGLRKAVVKAYPKANRKQLAGLVEKCLIMAELAGRNAVLEEL